MFVCTVGTMRRYVNSTDQPGRKDINHLVGFCMRGPRPAGGDQLMRAVVCREYGTPPEDLIIDELPDPPTPVPVRWWSRFTPLRSTIPTCC